MVAIDLRPSRLLVALTGVAHVIAALAPWFSALPVWSSLLMTTLVLLSLLYHLRNLRSPCWRRLILAGEECRPADCAGWRFMGHAYCAPGLQILYFRHEAARTALSDKAVLVLPDSCSAEERRQLRHFLHWRCV